MELAKHALEVVTCAYGVTVEAADARLRKRCVQPLLHFLRAGAEKMNVLAVAGRAPFGHGLAITAVVALHALSGLVKGQSDTAILALQDFAARPAQHHRRISAAVEQDHGLFAALQAFADFAYQLL